MSRVSKVFVSTYMALALQFVSAISAFIIPRLILLHFGSSYNGITSSIVQFISCVELLKSGIGAVTRSSLYKPLSDKNNYEINAILNATQIFMKKIAFFFGIFLIVFSCAYPLYINTEFDLVFSSSLIIIIGISTLVRYYFGITYELLLQADQKVYICSGINIIGVILNTLFASLLILCGFSIHIVKLGSAIAFLIQPILLYYYVRSNYFIDETIPPNNQVLGQRWDALGHQIANFIYLNSSMIILSFFVSLKEISVFAVYCLVVHSIKKILNSLTSGINAAFGNMLANKESQNLYNSFVGFDYFMTVISCVLWGCTAVLFLPFVSLFTKGVTDINYIRLDLVLLLVLVELIFSIRYPYQMLVYVYGNFKETKLGAYIEAGISVIGGILLTLMMGMHGVVVASLVATFFRTFDLIYYSNSNLLRLNVQHYVEKIVILIVFTIYNMVLFINIHYNCNSYSVWIVYGLFVFCSNLLLGVILTYCFHRKYLYIVWRKIAFSRRNHVG